MWVLEENIVPYTICFSQTEFNVYNEDFRRICAWNEIIVVFIIIIISSSSSIVIAVD